MEEAQTTAPPVTLSRPQHTISRALIDPDALWILRRLRREGYLAFLVGGAVRDLLLGREPKDFDLGTDARPSQVRRLFRNCRLIGRRFRLAHVYFRRRGKPENVIEVSTFRSRQKWDEADGIPPEDLDLSGHVFGPPEEDAQRRDFTVNGLFYDMSDFSVVDYVGGLADLEQGLIRLIGDPDDRFPEDPVRMLRAVEFAARLGFRIEEDTEAGIRKHAALIAQGAPARVRDELRDLQRRGILAEVLAACHRLDLLEPLLPEVRVAEGVFPLLEILDAESRQGETAHESRYLAALALPTVAAAYSLGVSANLDGAQRAIAGVLDPLTQRFHISAHIRHLAKELLLSCYRLARGKAYRTKGKFVRKPEFAQAWEFFRSWAELTGELEEAVAYWQNYLDGNALPSSAGKHRTPRRRRRRRRPRAGAEAAG